MSRGRRTLIGAVAVLDVTAALVAQLISPPGNIDPATAAIFTLAVASIAGVGAFLSIRVPENRVGWLLLVAGSMLGVGMFCGTYALASIAGGGTSPLTAYAAWLTDVLWVPPIVIVAAGVPMVFPDGRLPSPRWRPIAWLLIAGTVLSVLRPAFTPGPVNESMTVQNPFGVAVLAPYLPLADTVAMLTALPAFLGAWAAVATRYRRGTSVERQQIKWLLAVALVGVVAFPVAIVLDLLVPGTPVATGAWYVGFLALIGLPVSIGIAVLRYRLYEIDRLISRTIGWTLVTGLLISVFGTLLIALQAVLSQVTSGSTLAVAASTLAAFALFQPVRRRVQRAVDRRFDRARYDGERTATAFSGRLQQRVDLDAVEADLTDTVTLALRPSSTGVWIHNVRFHAPARLS
jgi:hypothetical protein